MNNNKVFISIGLSCIVKETLKELNVTVPERLPFDWIGTNSNFVSQSLMTDFKYWTKEYFSANGIHKQYFMLNIQHKFGENTGFIHELDYTHLVDSHLYRDYINIFDRNLPIKEESMKILVENYKRRIQRLKDVRDSGKELFFIWHSYTEDDAIKDIRNLWAAMNIFCKDMKFTLICIFHKKGGIDDYDEKYNVEKSRIYLRNIISRYF